MLADILYLMRERLLDLNIFGEVYPYAELVRKFDDGKPFVFPAVYKGNGEYNLIQYDATGGMCYFRKNGKASVSRNNDSDLKIVSCSNETILYNIRVPLKLVAFIPKSKANCEDGFEDDFFADLIMATISQAAISGTPAQEVSFIATGYDTDNFNVLSGEYSNSREINDINYTYSYLSIDFVLEYVIDKDCLNPCTDYAYQN